MNELRARDLVPGQHYRIVLSDCCIEGEIANAKFIGLFPFDDGSGGPDEGDYFVVKFEGIIFETAWQVSYFPVPPNDE